MLVNIVERFIIFKAIQCAKILYFLANIDPDKFR